MPEGEKATVTPSLGMWTCTQQDLICKAVERTSLSDLGGIITAVHRGGR